MAPKKNMPPPGQFCDLEESRGVKLYYEVHSPVRKKWMGDVEENLFLILGSVADLRKTTDQQYINQSMNFFKVLTYDHRNTGQSTIKDEPCTMEDYADDAAALLEAVMPDSLPVYVMGTSFGGMVGQHLAIRHPKLVKKLVLCCCSTGGEGGSSFAIDKWYAPGVTVEDRVQMKAFQANTDRTEEWKEREASQWKMVFALLSRDEQVGIDEPLRMEGTMRQLEARRAHDTWDAICDTKTPTLCLGSPKDRICEVEVTQKMADRMGADRRLDFDWGHSFIAADLDAMPFANMWLRSSGQVWKVVGGGDKGGILVRTECETTSPMAEDRLARDSLIREMELVELTAGSRLHYILLKGSGPKEGWVGTKLTTGKEICVQIDDLPYC